MQIQSANINLGETILHLLTLGDDGNMQLKKKFTQNQVIAFTGNLQTSLTGMEASSGAHFLGRALRETKVMT